MNTIDKLLVIGGGSALELYSSILQDLDIDIYILDNDEKRLNDIIKTYGFKKFIPEECLTPGLMLNLTPAYFHHEINLKYIKKGWLVYSEKPLVKNIEELSEIEEYLGRNLWVAPDVCMFDNYKKFSSLLAGCKDIKKVKCVYKTEGHEVWHPRPWVFFTKGGGVINDIFPYFSRVLIDIFGGYDILNTKNKMSTRLDFFSDVDVSLAANVPVYCNAKLISNNGIKIDLELDFNSKENVSYIRVDTISEAIQYDPVDTSSSVKVIDGKGKLKSEFKFSNADMRGLGIRSIIGNEKSVFTTLNADKQAMYSEQYMILCLNEESEINNE